MKKLLIFVSFILVANFSQAALPSAVSEALKKAGIPESSVGIFVQNVDSAKPTLQANGNKPMNPASVMKLVTTYAGLEILRPTFRWKTEAYSTAPIVNGVLDGDLILKGYGDPSFKEQEFRRFVVSLQQLGIKKITGDLVLDKTYFGNNIGGTKGFDSEKWRAYNAKPSALMVDGRKTSFKFLVNGDKVNVSQEVELPEVQIVNKMQLKKGYCGSWRNRMKYHVAANKQNAVVTFSGTFSEACGERYLELSLFDDNRYTFFAFKKLWQQLGGTFAGGLREQTVMPIQAEKLLIQVSQPLAYVIRDINKWSNNVMARQVLLTIGAEDSLQAANEVKGMLAIKKWLASTGHDVDGMVIENGSGLSRIERVKANMLGGMLVNAYYGARMSELMASLPIMSLDGTLRKRLRDQPVSGRAHMKTGSINHVSAIAGYVLDAKSRRHVVVMMVNDAKASRSKKAQDALINWVFNQP